MRILFDAFAAVILAPLVLGLAIVFAIIFGLIGGTASAVVAAWPILLFYHDRYLITIIPLSWTADFIARIQEYVAFHDDPNRRR